MNALALVLGTLIAQPFLPPASAPAPAAAPQGESPVFRVVGIAATQEGHAKPEIDKQLRPYRAVFKEMENVDTFKLVSMEERPVPLGQESKFVINGQYRMYVQPTDASESDGLKIHARIETDTPGGPMDALRVPGEVQMNRALIFNGMELGDGELVVILTLLPGEGDDQQQPQPGDEQESENEGEQREEPEEPQEPEDTDSEPGEPSPEMEESEGEPEPPEAEGEASEEDAQPELRDAEGESDAPPPPRGDASESGEMPDLDTIDALLESLEETDQQEQRNAHNRDRKAPRISGEWW